VNQESFINISVPKIDKDYSLYRTYVIFRTLGLRHLIVVDVHNRVVGLITRKDLMPFKMQERLETLLDQTTTLHEDPEFGANGDVVQKKSMDSGKGSCYDTYEKLHRPSDSSYNLSADGIFLPAITKVSTANRMCLNELDERDDVQSTTSVVTSDASDEATLTDTKSSFVSNVAMDELDESDDARSITSAAAADTVDGASDRELSTPTPPIQITISPPDDDDVPDDGLTPP